MTSQKLPKMVTAEKVTLDESDLVPYHNEFMDGIIKRAKILFDAGKERWEVRKEIPEINIATWNVHKAWCSNLRIDPYSCGNWSGMIPDEEKEERDQARSNLWNHDSIWRFEQQEHVIDLIGKGLIHASLIGTIWKRGDGICIYIKPWSRWPRFFLIPYWELTYGLLSHSAYVTARRIIATRWVELNPGEELPEALQAENVPDESYKARLDLDAETEAVVQGLAALYKGRKAKKPTSKGGAIKRVIAIRQADLRLYSEADKTRLLDRFRKDMFSKVWNASRQRQI